MFTGLSTAAGPVMHIGASSDACLIPAFARTSTGRGTRRRGNPGRPGAQSGPARLSDLTHRGVSTLTDGRQDQGPRDPSKASAGEDRREPDRDRWTARGSTSWNAGDQERDRIQLTITGVRLADAEARVLNLNGQVQPGLGEGTRKTGSPGIFVPSLNSGPRIPQGPAGRCPAGSRAGFPDHSRQHHRARFAAR